MARISTPGIWLPGPLNTINSSSPTSQADIAGNPFYMGLNPGKMVVLGPDEAQSVAAPGTTLYDGSYQYVQLDSGATAALATNGFAAYLLLDQGGPAQGTNPETAYNTPVVTTKDVAAALYGGIGAADPYFCGIFINPATVNGQANGPTPGNWTEIFVGGGRATLQVGVASAVALGNVVFPDSSGTGKFGGATTTPTNGKAWGTAVTAGATSATAVGYFSEIIFRFAD